MCQIEYLEPTVTHDDLHDIIAKEISSQVEFLESVEISVFMETWKRLEQGSWRVEDVKSEVRIGKQKTFSGQSWAAISSCYRLIFYWRYLLLNVLCISSESHYF